MTQLPALIFRLVKSPRWLRCSATSRDGNNPLDMGLRKIAKGRSPPASGPGRKPELTTLCKKRLRLCPGHGERSPTTQRTAMRRSILRTDEIRERSIASQRDAERRSTKIPLRHHLKVHLFRALTVVLAWLLIVAMFYERPEVLTGAQRLIQRGIESVGDAIPSPWGPRIEFVFREIGGLIWLQITLFVVMLRVALSTLAALWRLVTRRDQSL
jgi:hypothetical protein